MCIYTSIRACSLLTFLLSFSTHQHPATSSTHQDFWRFRNNCFLHNFFRFHDLVFFFILRKNSIDFFLQFSSIYLSISKLLQFSLNFFNLLQFTSCSKFLSPIFSFFLTSHSCLTFNFVEKNLTNGSHPRYHRRRFRDTMCEPYKSLNSLAKPISNHFLQFSLNFFNLLQFASCSFFFLQFSPFFLWSFYFLLFSLNRVSVSRESSARISPVGATLR